MEFNLADLQRDWIEGISGAEFFDCVQGYRSQLETLPKKDRARGILIEETDPIQFAAAFFATVSLAAPVILANPNWGRQEGEELARLVAPAMCFGQRYIPLCGGSPRVGVASSVEDVNNELPPASILIPTGGTTGGVKLAIHTWASLEAACRGVQAFLGGGAIDSCCVLPLYHVSGLMQLLRSFITGGRIRFDEDEVAGRCLSYVPTQLQRALRSEECIRKLNTTRAIFVGGAAMPEGVTQQARARKLPIVPVYGMTETAAMVAAVPMQDFLAKLGAAAVPLGETHFSVELDGRLRISSPALFLGYQGQPPINHDKGYLTDDEARLDEDGRLHVLGRMDRLINSGGEKIDPAEVEAALLHIKGIEEALVVGVPDPEWGQRVVAYYTGAEVSGLKEQLRQWLAPYKVPKSWIRCDTLPLDGKGKFVAPRRSS